MIRKTTSFITDHCGSKKSNTKKRQYCKSLWYWNQTQFCLFQIYKKHEWHISFLKLTMIKSGQDIAMIVVFLFESFIFLYTCQWEGFFSKGRQLSTFWTELQVRMISMFLVVEHITFLLKHDIIRSFIPFHKLFKERKCEII